LKRVSRVSDPVLLDFKPVAMYLVAAALLFAAMLAWQGLNRRAMALALPGGV